MTKIIPLCFMNALCVLLLNNAHASDSTPAIEKNPKKNVWLDGWFAAAGLGIGEGRSQLEILSIKVSEGPRESYSVFTFFLGKEWDFSNWNSWITEVSIRSNPVKNSDAYSGPSVAVGAYWNPTYNSLIQPFAGFHVGGGDYPLNGFRLGNKSDLNPNWSLRYGFETFDSGISILGTRLWEGQGVFLECTYRIK
jgi:hypothetical protein